MQVVSCSKRLTPEQYMAYMQKQSDKFSESVKHHGVSAKICYIPSEYYAAREMTFDSTLSKEKALDKYKNSLFFTCTVTADSMDERSFLLTRDGAAGFSANVFKNYFGHTENIFLLYGTDTVKCDGYQYDRNWGMTNDDSFLIAFNKEKIKSSIDNYHLIMREITEETGTIDIELHKLIKKAPQLKG